MKKVVILFPFLVIMGLGWYFGQPDFAQTVTDKAQLSKVSADNGVVKGDTTDGIAPISVLDEVYSMGYGGVITGRANDLGFGIAQVNIQIQRESDGGVWDGKNWQQRLGEVVYASILESKFVWKVNLVLEKGQKYLIRSQAIDLAGNAQTKWSQIEVYGSDLGQPALN